MIGFIGGGNMAEALLKGIDRDQLLVSEPRDERRRYLEQTCRIKTTSSNTEVAASCDIIILAIKPQNMDTVLTEIADLVAAEKTVISIAAGVPLSYLQARLRTRKLVRVMPNTPALVQEGMSVMSLCECLPDSDMSTVREIFMSVGRVLVLPEKYMDAVTALSGSGPAFIALFVESLITAGTDMGLSPETAAELVMQTLLGTAALLKTGMTPAQLREMVTSPGGTTAAGLDVFRARGLENMVGQALDAARRRAEELGRRVQ